MTVKFMIGDVIEQLRLMDADSVDCVCTSPPYWGLRDYNVEGQIGLEPTLAEHMGVLVDVFAEIKRVLKPSGTVWLNYGDCYASTPNGRSAADVKALGKDDRAFRDKPFSTIQGVLKPKDLCMLPNRLAIALQEAGWWIRSEIIWAKPNPMPESVTDRPAGAHEKIFLLTKSKKYFYDAKGSRQSAEAEGGRNLRNYEPAPMQVWNMATMPFKDAHFATFPPELVQRCLTAGCPKDGHVLDPFGGAGTTGLVADRMQLDCTLIEINPLYVEMAKKRLDADAPPLERYLLENE